MLEGRRVALEDSQPQGEPEQQTQPVEWSTDIQQVEQTEEIEEAP